MENYCQLQKGREFGRASRRQFIGCNYNSQQSMQQLKELSTGKNYEKFDQKIPNKQFLLGRFYDTTAASLISPPCTGRHHTLKSKLGRLLEKQLKIHDKLIPSRDAPTPNLTNPNPPAFEFYLPLNKLWNQYILDLIQKQHNQESKELKILRSDFHGAYLTVIGSKNQTLIGLEGIVIKETLRTFSIAVKVPKSQSRQGTSFQTKNTKVVLKSVCVFMIQVSDQHRFVVNGSSLVYRPSDRIRHRFKFKKADSINHQLIGFLDQAKLENQEFG